MIDVSDAVNIFYRTVAARANNNTLAESDTTATEGKYSSSISSQLVSRQTKGNLNRLCDCSYLLSVL